MNASMCATFGVHHACDILVVPIEAVDREDAVPDNSETLQSTNSSMFALAARSLSQRSTTTRDVSTHFNNSYNNNRTTPASSLLYQRTQPLNPTRLDSIKRLV